MLRAMQVTESKGSSPDNFPRDTSFLEALWITIADTLANEICQIWTFIIHFCNELHINTDDHGADLMHELIGELNLVVHEKV